MNTNPSTHMHTYKEVIYSKEASAPIGAYSQAIKVGHTVYISGQISMGENGELIKGNFSDQFRQAIANLSAITKAAGGSLADIVKATIYVTDMANFSALNTVMAEYFQPPYPARAVIEVKGLPKQAAVEIEAIMQCSDPIK